MAETPHIPVGEDSLPTAPTVALPGPWLGRIDRYVVSGRLGRGGFGAVLRATDTVTGIEVALKLLPPEVSRDDEQMESVRRNFVLVQQLVHPGIVPLRHLHRAEQVDEPARRDLGVHTGDYVVVMDVAPGTTMSKWRREHPGGQVPVPKALSVCLQLAIALDYAHSRRVMHRDIKPANIMVDAGRDGTPDVRLLDFGLAAEIHSSLSRISRDRANTSGTPPYMPPEQWQGQTQNASSDQYALAVVFHELVSGAVPFAAVFASGNDFAMFRAVMEQQPAPLQMLSASQNATLARALAKEPRRRFASCADFIDALSGSLRAAPPPVPAASPETATTARNRTAPTVVATGLPASAEARTAGARYWITSGAVALAIAGCAWLMQRAYRHLSAAAPAPAPAAAHAAGVQDARAFVELMRRPTQSPPAPATAAPPAANRGRVRVMIDMPTTAMNWLYQADKRIKVGDGVWQTVPRLPYVIDGLACAPTDISLDVTGCALDSASRRVTPTEGKAADACFVLTLKPAMVTVECDTPGAAVYDAAGTRLGSVNAPLALAPFTSHELEVRASGRTPAKLYLPFMNPESKVRHTATLSPLRTAGQSRFSRLARPEPAPDWKTVETENVVVKAIVKEGGRYGAYVSGGQLVFSNDVFTTSYQGRQLRWRVTCVDRDTARFAPFAEDGTPPQ